jgi:hypothetical protein
MKDLTNRGKLLTEPGKLHGVSYDHSLYEQSLVGFIDILGWRNLITGVSSDVSLFQNIVSAYQELVSQGTEDFLALKRGFVAPRMMIASDSIFVTCPAHPDHVGKFVARCGWIAASLLLHGYLSRGAISVGKIFHEGVVIFGDGLTDAYLKEQSVAKYPRTIVSPEVVSLLKVAPPYGPTMEMITEDQDGEMRLDLFKREFAPPDVFFPYELGIGILERDREHFHWYLSKCRNSIVIALNKVSEGTREFDKVKWLADQFNVACRASEHESIRDLAIDGEMKNWR